MTVGGARFSARGCAHARNAKKAPAAAARVANGDPCDRPGGRFVTLVIRRAGFAIQASTSHGNGMKAQLPMLTLMYDARVLELFEAMH